MICALLLTVAAAELGRIGGTFDGGTWELDLTAHSVADVVVDGETVRVITSGGALGELDADTGALTRLTLPDVPLGGFVRGARRPHAFDVSGRIHAVAAGGLVPTGRGPGRPGIRAAWRTPWGVSTVMEREDGRVSWRPALGPPRRLPESVVWARIGGRVVWGARDGEFGGGFGQGPWRLNKRMNVVSFGELEGRPVVAGGLCHLMCCDGQILSLWGRRLHSAVRCLDGFDDEPGETGPPPLSQPVAWVGDVAGVATAVDLHGDVFVRDGEAWTGAGAFRPPQRALRVDHHVAVRAHAEDEDRDTVWLAAPHHPPLRIGPGGVERTLPATAPLADELRWRHGRLWALDETDVWERTPDGWTRHAQPAAPPGEQTSLRAVLTGPDRPTWVWVDYEADILRFDGPRTVRAGLTDDLLDVPDGSVLRGSKRRCADGEPPCLADHLLEGAHRWTADGHVGRAYRWWDAEGTRIEPPAAEPGDWTPVALPLIDGGWLLQRGNGQIERFDAAGARTTLGVLPRLHDLAEVDGRIWLLGEQVWLLDDGALRALDLPPIGTARWLEPMDPGTVALAAEAGVLVLRMSPDGPGRARPGSTRPSPTLVEWSSTDSLRSLGSLRENAAGDRGR